MNSADVSAGDEMVCICKRKLNTPQLWLLKEINPKGSYYDVLCPFDEAPNNMKIGDNIVGTVKEINIAHDGTPGVFLKNIKITH